MPDFAFDPPVLPKPSIDGFMQTVRLIEGTKVLGLARWHVRAAAPDGVVQLLDLNIAQGQTRKGNGRRLLQGVIAQAQLYHRARKTRLRRMWIAVEQKGHVIGRAFLTQNGFHHITTLSELMKDQDCLLYVRSFD